MFLFILLYSGEVDEMEGNEKDCLRVFKAITVIKEHGMVMLEVRTIYSILLKENLC